MRINLNKQKSSRGFTLIELMVVISIIGILSAIVYANFGEARKIARDEIRKTGLKEMQLALQLYKAQNGHYPDQGCGNVVSDPNSGNTEDWAGPGPVASSWGASCTDYVVGLVPDFIAALSTDPNQESVTDKGFYYKTNSSGSDYKLIINQSTESKFITSYDDEFARCPAASATAEGGCPAGAPQSNTYTVYSAGAANW